MATEQVRDCCVGDILLFKNRDSRLITRIDYDPREREACTLHTTDLAGENPHSNTYSARDRVIYRGAQEALF